MTTVFEPPNPNSNVLTLYKSNRNEAASQAGQQQNNDIKKQYTPGTWEKIQEKKEYLSALARVIYNLEFVSTSGLSTKELKAEKQRGLNELYKLYEMKETKKGGRRTHKKRRSSRTCKRRHS